MNEQISWDHSIIKKYSASNHFKLLNQLRSEVKKYPLNKKKNSSSDNINNDNLNSKLINNTISNNNLSIVNDSNVQQGTDINHTTISFNNSKNFSIYNNTFNDSPQDQEESIIAKENNCTENTGSSTFKDRLKKVDMK